MYSLCCSHNLSRDNIHMGKLPEKHQTHDAWIIPLPNRNANNSDFNIEIVFIISRECITKKTQQKDLAVPWPSSSHHLAISNLAISNSPDLTISPHYIAISPSQHLASSPSPRISISRHMSKYLSTPRYTSPYLSSSRHVSPDFAIFRLILPRALAIQIYWIK